MPRVRYIDEQSHEGEMDLGRVRVGDLVRFLADFRKLAGPKGVFEVRKNEIGEVTACGPETVRVKAPGLRTAGGDAFSEDVEADLQVGCIAVLVDSRDPRISSQRVNDEQRLAELIAEANAHPEDWRLFPYRIAGGPVELPPDHQAGMPVPKGGSSCMNCRFLQEGMQCSSPEFQAWNRSPQIPAAEADSYCSDWWEPKQAAEEAEPRTAALESWELEMLVGDARRVGVDVFDQRMVAAELVRTGFRTRRAAVGNAAARLVLETAPHAWRLFAFMQEGDDKPFERTPTDPEPLLGVDPEAPKKPTPEEAAEQERVNEQTTRRQLMPAAAYKYATWAVTAMAAEFEAFNGHRPDLRNREDVIGAIEMLAADLEVALPRAVYTEPAAKPELENAKQTAKRLRTLVRELGQLSDEEWLAGLDELEAVVPRPAPATPPVAQEPLPPPEVTPAPAAPAEPPAAAGGEVDPDIRLPVGLPPGHGNQRVYADPGMTVYSKSKAKEGKVLGGAPDVVDGIVVELEDGRQDVWDAMDVTVGKGWKGPRRPVPLPEVDRWKKERRQRLRPPAGGGMQLRQSERGHVACYQAGDGDSPHARDASHVRAALDAAPGAQPYSRRGDGGGGPDRGPGPGGGAHPDAAREARLGPDVLVDGDGGHRAAGADTWTEVGPTDLDAGLGVLTPEQIRASLERGARDAAEMFERTRDLNQLPPSSLNLVLR